MIYDNRKACINCINDPFLRDLISNNGETGICDWCDTENVRLINIFQWSKMFRAVADCRDEITGPKAYLRGETIKRKKHADIDEWQTEMQLKAMQIGTVHLYSGGLPDREHALTGVKIVQNLESAVIRSAQRHKTDAVIPQGPYVMPFVAGEGPI